MFSALIDKAHGFAYFASDTQPGIVTKVRLSDFTRVGSLVFSGRGEQFSSAAVIDTTNGFAYFGSFFSGRIEKVRLSDFTEVAVINAKPQHGVGFVTAVIDTVNGFAYFGDLFGTVVKIRLSDFKVVGTLTLPNGIGLFGSLIDNTNTFAYFSNGEAGPGTIYQIRLSNFTLANSLSTGQPLGPTPVFDPTTNLSYWGTLTDPGVILRVRLPDLTLRGNVTLNPGEGSLNSALIDPAEGFAYFATQTTTTPTENVISSEIIKINLGSFKRASTLTLAPYEALLFLSAGSVIDTEATGGSFAYFSTYTSPASVIKVKLSNMSRAGTLTLQQGQEFFDSSVIDTQAGFVYFGTDSTPFGTGNATGAITRIRTSDFTPAGTLVLKPGEGELCSGVIDTVHGFAYFGTRGFPGVIIKVRLSDFTRVADLRLNTFEDGACTAAIDTRNSFAYFGTLTFPGIIAKIRLSDFKEVGSITLNPGEDAPLSAAIDVSAGFVYFGTQDFPGIIVKIRTSDLTEVASLTLHSNENAPGAAIIDPAHGFAYFGTFDTPAVVVKIRLSDFSNNASLTLTCPPSPSCLFGPSSVGSGVIDPSHDAGYFGAQGEVVKVQLSTLTQVSLTPTINPNDFLFSASIDTAAGTAYFGVSTSPGKVYRVSL